MYRRVAHRLTLRTAIALTICFALLPIPRISVLVSGAAQSQREERKGKPKPGKPEGVFPDVEEAERQAQIVPEAPPPIPSTIRSKRNEGKRGMGGVLGIRNHRGLSAVTLSQIWRLALNVFMSLVVIKRAGLMRVRE